MAEGEQCGIELRRVGRVRVHDLTYFSGKSVIIIKVALWAVNAQWYVYSVIIAPKKLGSKHIRQIWFFSFNFVEQSCL